MQKPDRRPKTKAGQTSLVIQQKTPPARTVPSTGEALARDMIAPSIGHGRLAGAVTAQRRASLPTETRPGLGDTIIGTALANVSLARGDKAAMARMLAAQAASLDTLFTDLAIRAVSNLDSFPDAAERFLRLALKSVAGSRATILALADLHRPTDPLAPRVHVGEGAQAIVANNFHHHAKGLENEKSADQPHAAATSERAPLRRQNAIGRALHRPDDQR